MILVTGGAGFIGSNFITSWLSAEDGPVVNVDKLTYAGNLHNLASLKADKRHVFEHADICDMQQMRSLFETYRPLAVVHFAAESHVDRSISEPADFIKTNINGTFTLLEAAREYWLSLSVAEKEAFRFLHVSTDEVYGALAAFSPPFSEQSPYAPNSPYSASKAAADHLVRCYHQTYGLPTLTVHCSNNYGPYQFPEKLIPLMICRALSNEAMPLYGDGLQVRDWLHVRDHCAAIRCVLRNGTSGGIYNVGGWNEKTNLEVAHVICDILDKLVPKKNDSYREQIAFVADRPGHDRRYAINAGKIARELGWQPVETFESGIAKTVQWYLDNQDWVHDVQSGDYMKWRDRSFFQSGA